MFNSLSSHLLERASFTVHELREIEKACTQHILKPGEMLLTNGTVCTSHTFVCQGLLRGYTYEDTGIEKTLFFAPENFWAGDRESLLSGNPSGINIVAETECAVLGINHDTYNDLCVTIPAFTEYMISLVQRNLSSRQGQIMASILTDDEKIAQFMQKYPSVPARTSAVHIASMLSVAPDVVKKAL